MQQDPSQRGLLSSLQQDGPRSSLDADDSDHDPSDIDATEYLTAADPLYADQSTESADRCRNHKDIERDARLLYRHRRYLPRHWTRSRCCVVAAIVTGVVALVAVAGGGFVYKKIVEDLPYGESPPWYPTPRGGTARAWVGSYAKAAAMVRRMTLAEKVNITTGTGWQMGLAVGTTGPAVHVGFPQLSLQDGPLGLRFVDNATAFPAGITVGATWNRALMYERGKAHGKEARGKGIQVILGPSIGPLGRMPAGGRNWEGFGADPYLQGIAGAQTIRGIQDQGVMATVKHFVANEQEHFRQPYEWGLPQALSANIDDRTLHELYAWPFGDAIHAGVASIMCSYNMVNSSYSCGNSKLLNGILKDEMGFQGFVMSDWLAQRSGVSTALAGLDMTMPGDGLRWKNGDSLWGPHLTCAVLNGSVPLERLNDMVTRIVASWYQMGQDNPSFRSDEKPNFSSWTNDRVGILAPGSPSPQDEIEVNQYVNVQDNHSALARTIAAEGIVLLKNNYHTLPISTDGVTGAQGRLMKTEHPTAPGAGSEANPMVNIGIFGEDAGPGKGPNFCQDRGCNQGTLGSGWGSGAVDFPYLVPPVDALEAGFDDSKVILTKYLSNHDISPDDLATLDVCIVFANADAGEGFLSWGGVAGDRNDLLLQKGADDLVFAVASGCKGDVIVVVHAVGPVVMERWIDLPRVKAVLHAHLPGQESGNALVDVLFGRTNPSGKLPYTIGRSLEDYGHGGQVMYFPNAVTPQQNFSEGLYIDYRYFDKHDIKPRFEFGYGLSYSTFELGNLTVHSTITMKTAFPPPRPEAAAPAPEYDTDLPKEVAKEVLVPEDLRPLKKYIYPYLSSVDEIVSTPYPYPDGYDIPQPPSNAGGDEGGNPDLWATYVMVTVDVHNAGPLDGQVVVQLYVAYPEEHESGDPVDLPVKVLRGFEKPLLRVGEATTVTFNLTRRDLSYWDVVHQNWRMFTKGEYRFLVGHSSRDLPLEGKY